MLFYKDNIKKQSFNRLVDLTLQFALMVATNLFLRILMFTEFGNLSASWRNIVQKRYYGKYVNEIALCGSTYV